MTYYAPIVGDELTFDVYCVDATGTQTSDNRYWYNVGAITGGGPDLEDLAIAFDAHVFTEFQACLTSAANYYGTKCSAPEVVPFPLPALSTLNRGAGTSGPDPLPTQTCGIIQSLTDRSGRKFRGRTYIPFPSTADCFVDGAPTASYVVRLKAIADVVWGFASAITLSDIGWGTITLVPNLYHRATKTASVITGYRAHQKWATQRRRGDYGKVNLPPS